MRYHDGSTYTGDWKNDLKHGQGEEIWSDGTRVQCRYEKGLKEGQGVI
jgi:hypothetical protein